MILVVTDSPVSCSASRDADVVFLRDRCSWLQRALTRGIAAEQIDDIVLEGEVLSRWSQLLVPDTGPWRPAAQLALEELYLLHARVIERLARGGVGDISQEVEHLARAVWVDRLQRATDDAVALIRGS